MKPVDTADKEDDKDGSERFHPFDLPTSLLYSSRSNRPSLVADWFAAYTVPFKQNGGLRESLRGGLGCCSSGSVSFHGIAPEHMWELFAAVGAL